MDEAYRLSTGPSAIYSNIQQWVAFGFLTLILLTATDVFTRFGISTILWVLIYIISLVYIVWDYQRFINYAVCAWPAFMLPVFTLLSTFWSETPEWTLYASIQLAYTTIIAVWISTRFNALTIFKALGVATGIGVGASIANEYIQFISPYQAQDYEGAPNILIGVYDQKNGLGNAFGLLVLSLLVLGIQYKKITVAMLVALLLLMPLQKAQATRSLLIYIVTLGLPFYWLILKSKGQRILIMIFGGVTFLFLLFLFLALDINVINLVLESVGKDSTLTGRTLIWNAGINVFVEHPFLGVGYQSFWQPGVFQEVSHLHSVFHGQNFNVFHSSYVEVLVALGIFGLLGFFMLLLYTTYQSIRWFSREGSVSSFGVVFFILVSIIIASTETIMFKQHEISYILLISFLSISTMNNMQRSSSRSNVS